MAVAKRTIDAFVIGGGPAGLAAAIALRKAGMTVALADVRRPPIDKVCGEGLLPPALAALNALEVPLPLSLGRAVRGIRFRTRSIAATAYFPQRCGLGLRRIALHRALAEHAASVGVSLLWAARAELLSGGGVWANGSEWSARWIVGADGQHSQVRRAARLDRPREFSRRYAFRRHFAAAPWTDCVEVYWAAEGQAYVTPIADREVCVALAVEDKNACLAQLPRIFPLLSERLAAAEPTTGERGASTVCRRLPAVTRDPVALIGDASGSVDAITGAGLAIAFQQAVALGEALPRGDPNLYEEKYSEIFQVPCALSQALVFLGRHPRLQARAIRASQADGSLMAELMEAHLGARPLWRLTPASLARFGWNCMAA